METSKPTPESQKPSNYDGAFRTHITEVNNPLESEQCINAKNRRDLPHHFTDIHSSRDMDSISKKLDVISDNLDKKFSVLDKNLNEKLLVFQNTAIENLNSKYNTLHNQINFMQTEIKYWKAGLNPIHQMFSSFLHKLDIKSPESSISILFNELLKRFAISFKDDLEASINGIFQKRITERLPEDIKNFELRLELLKEDIREIKLEISKTEECQKITVNKTIESHQLFESAINEIKDKIESSFGPNLKSLDQSINDKLEKLNIDIQNLNKRFESERKEYFGELFIKKSEFEEKTIETNNETYENTYNCKDIVKDFNQYYSNFEDILNDFSKN